MDKEMIKQEIELTYDKVKSLAGWSVDKNVVLTITSYYVTLEKEFDAVSFSRAIDAIKSKSSWLSPLRGNLLPMVAAFLDQGPAPIQDEVNRLFVKQQALKNAGFRNTIHSYLAALLVSNDESLYEVEAKRAKQLYDAMKKQHYFLTSDDDYSYAVLLAKQETDPMHHAKSMRTYYDAFRAEGFRAGNELQWLSQIMTYLNAEFNPLLVSRAMHIYDTLKRETKVRQVHYPLIGFLTVFQVEDRMIQEIIELTHTLEQSKRFKWNREMALSVAAGNVVHQLTVRAEEISVSLATSIELILQAQQAVMAATVAAVAASAATNSSSTT